MTVRPVLAVSLAAAVGLASCAHVDEVDHPLRMTERVIRDACIPFVVDQIDADEVGRRLGGWWTRNLPDPFTPPAGPIFRNSGVRIQVIDGRRARTSDGALTRRPMRICQMWMGPLTEVELVAAVTAAAEGAPGVVVARPGTVDGYRRIVACIPSSDGRIAVVGAMVYRNGKTGANVVETDAGPRGCVG